MPERPAEGPRAAPPPDVGGPRASNIPQGLDPQRPKGINFRVWGLGFGVQGLGFRVQGLGFRVFRVWGSGFILG